MRVIYSWSKWILSHTHTHTQTYIYIYIYRIIIANISNNIIIVISQRSFEHQIISPIPHTNQNVVCCECFQASFDLCFWSLLIEIEHVLSHVLLQSFQRSVSDLFTCKDCRKLYTTKLQIKLCIPQNCFHLYIAQEAVNRSDHS